MVMPKAHHVQPVPDPRWLFVCVNNSGAELSYSVIARTVTFNG
jgi:hypothetical protein